MILFHVSKERGIFVNYIELSVFIAYFVFMVAIGLYFFSKSKGAGEKDYFLGGRNMGAWVSALSAGASDMSAWVLMGLPASIYLSGMGQTWIAIGLGIGYAVSWIFMAPRLRRFSIAANDSITIPQYLTNRFLSKNKSLQILSAIIFLVAYTIYAASSIKACGTLFNTVMDIDPTVAMYIAAFIIVAYTFLGGFSAVCWTDFFQGMIMLAALLIAPLFALALAKAGDGAATGAALPDGFFNFFTTPQDIISGLGWGLGYFGMPQVLLRFMGIRSEHELGRSRRVAIIWVVISMAAAVFIGVVGRSVAGLDYLSNNDAENIFIDAATSYLPPILAGFACAGVLAAAISSSDSYLLISASAVSQNLYRGVFKKDATEKQVMWCSRITLVIITIVAMAIAWNSNSTIFGITSFAWAGFGAAFGPLMLLSLFWKRTTYQGAIAGMVAGGAMVFFWKLVLKPLGGMFGIYELLPAFIFSVLVIVVVSLCTAEPDAQITEEFDKVKSGKGLQ